ATRSTTPTVSVWRMPVSSSPASTPTTTSSSSSSCRARCTLTTSPRRRTPSCARVRRTRIRSSAGSSVRRWTVTAPASCSTSTAMTEQSGGAETLRDEPFAPEVVAAETVFAGRVWDIRAERFRYGDGELMREYMAHPGAAAVVALDDRGRVLLIQQYRHPIRQRDWELPAGLLDVPGEDPMEAARRELAEEADLEAEHWEKLLAFAPTPGGCDEI